MEEKLIKEMDFLTLLLDLKDPGEAIEKITKHLIGKIDDNEQHIKIEAAAHLLVLLKHQNACLPLKNQKEAEDEVHD